MDGADTVGMKRRKRLIEDRPIGEGLIEKVTAADLKIKKPCWNWRSVYTAVHFFLMNNPDVLSEFQSRFCLLQLKLIDIEFVS